MENAKFITFNQNLVAPLMELFEEECEDTISINHNWFNAYNLSWVWDLLLRDYNEANEYIQDIKDICDDFEGVCQRNLSVNTGMNFYDFLVFVVRFSFSNIAQLYHLATTNLHMSWRSSQMARQIIFNLESSRDIALKMKSTGAADNQSAIDFKTTLEDSTFMELCLHFGRTYLMINEQCEVNLDRKQALEVDLLDLGLPETSSSYVCTPQDLVHFIDYACAKLLTMAKGAGS
ncbi:hypothetical protein RJ640_005172 [Escallonia rubra]|uniref:Uncharacterized protein n=1 Tax=Escallonia rubra TaxID=112253 RepID=A0AA88RW73_9ASTE|nr:hypothetical protein RJ640_005172 [Escallonia rubra]